MAFYITSRCKNLEEKLYIFFILDEDEEEEEVGVGALCSLAIMVAGGCLPIGGRWDH